ncbi:CoA-transferase family III [Salipiger thiooxidans]|uniref:CoA-transferase family III n=1 Tax=Salipiger thiooxidans TaxID=282683 RepID=A0A1G7G135_9RHOB|nr:CoA transferase [Salipiger thiooxidans]SDE81826.1 CoA-transferase family III [Salipiger thiooxidans]
MPRAFDGLRVIDAPHVLAGTFAAYQLAVPGAEVIKIDRPDDPGQVRRRVSTTFCWFPPESAVTGASSDDALRRTCLEMPVIGSSALALLKQPRLETFCGTQSTALSRMVCISGSASCLRSPGARPMGTMK